MRGTGFCGKLLLGGVARWPRLWNGISGIALSHVLTSTPWQLQAAARDCRRAPSLYNVPPSSWKHCSL